MSEKGFFSKFKDGLAYALLNPEFDDDFYEELEEILVMGDIGVNTAEKIIERLKEKVKTDYIRKTADLKNALISIISEMMMTPEDAYDFEKEPSVILLIGVNGVGKTTTAGKLAGKYKNEGKKVLLAAADTFRAGATEQLKEWALRTGVDIIASGDNADPASVIYDAVNAAKARNVDILICDTAGRLHNKKNLMEELKKISRIIEREYPGVKRENLVVLDATTGQNALNQAKEFSEVCDLTGIVLTKLDGTAKGGIVVAIEDELTVPVKFAGVGEKVSDLKRFEAENFVKALMDNDIKAEEELFKMDTKTENVNE